MPPRPKRPNGLTGRRLRCLAIVLVIAGFGCAKDPAVPDDAAALRHDVFVEAIAPGVWRHVSYREFSGRPFASNGLIVDAGGRALVVDTAWNDTQTATVLDWAGREVGPVSAVVMTHAHDDRVGGIAEVHRRGIESVALEATAMLAVEDGWPSPTLPVASGFSLSRFGVDGELFFPGAGHSPDNAVVYLEDAQTLAGTCMVRALEAGSLGNLADANVEAWPASVRAIVARYPDVRLVVPGHGTPGDATLLAHTLELLEARTEKP